MQKRNILLYKNIYVSDKDTYILTFPGHIYIYSSNFSNVFFWQPSKAIKLEPVKPVQICF